MTECSRNGSRNRHPDRQTSDMACEALTNTQVSVTHTPTHTEPKANNNSRLVLMGAVFGLASQTVMNHNQSVLLRSAPLGGPHRASLGSQTKSVGQRCMSEIIIPYDHNRAAGTGFSLSLSLLHSGTIVWPWGCISPRQHYYWTLLSKTRSMNINNC